MNIFSVILIVIGIVLFVAAYLPVERRWASVPLGLAFGWSGLLLHWIMRTEHLVTINWN